MALGDLGGWHADTRLDATGLQVLPGVMDTQVHFREPGLTHKETLEAGTRAPCSAVSPPSLKCPTPTL